MPFALLSVVLARTSYLYYMVFVMPGLYPLVADLLARHRHHRRLVTGWVICVLAAALVLYPLTPLPW